MRILLSAASESERAYLGRALSESLNSVETTDDLRFARYLATHESFDAVVICAPHDDDGTLEAGVQGLRGDLPSISLVVVLARATSATCVRLLRAGADACFVQPHSVLEVIERLRVLCRNACVVRLPGGRTVRLDPFTREFVDGANRVALTKREYLLLECLLREAGMPISREQLIRYAWPEKTGVELTSLNLMILRLRRKFAQAGIEAMVQTVSRYGYRLATE